MDHPVVRDHFLELPDLIIQLKQFFSSIVTFPSFVLILVRVYDEFREIKIMQKFEFLYVLEASLAERLDPLLTQKENPGNRLILIVLDHIVVNYVDKVSRLFEVVNHEGLLEFQIFYFLVVVLDIQADDLVGLVLEEQLFLGHSEEHVLEILFEK